jgi:hypothetical protein
VHYLSSPCTLSSLVVHSLSRLCTSIHPLRLLSAFIPSVHHVHLDPSIAPLYLLRYSTADPLNSLVDIQGKPPIVQVGHYGQPTVTFTDEASKDDRAHSCTHSYSNVGTRCAECSVTIHGSRISVLPLLTLDSIVAYDLIEGAVSSACFVRFLREQVVCLFLSAQ